MVRHITTDFDLMQAEILTFLQKKNPRPLLRSEDKKTCFNLT